MIYDIAIVAIGLLAGWILFFKFRVMRPGRKCRKKISVIIPARNEEKNIALLLNDLILCSDMIHEVICVDDNSTDATAHIAKGYKITLINASQKPDDWTGKCWACKAGSDVATGDLLLFLDADVRIRCNGLAKIISEHERTGKTISVQPYHKTNSAPEQFSMFFNLTQTAANGTCFSKSGFNAGLYGPVILMSARVYETIGGHGAVSTSVVEDVKLGKQLKSCGFAYKLFLGDSDISYRMYSSGISELAGGWMKNYASGAFFTHPAVLIAVFLWITSCTATFAFLIRAIFMFDVVSVCIMSAFYIMWAVHLRFVQKHIGNFYRTTCILFPIFLGFFVGIFILSLIKKIFRVEVSWKDRKVKPEG